MTHFDIFRTKRNTKDCFHVALTVDKEVHVPLFHFDLCCNTKTYCIRIEQNKIICKFIELIVFKAFTLESYLRVC